MICFEVKHTVDLIIRSFYSQVLINGFLFIQDKPATFVYNKELKTIFMISGPTIMPPLRQRVTGTGTTDWEEEWALL